MCCLVIECQASESIIEKEVIINAVTVYYNNSVNYSFMVFSFYIMFYRNSTVINSRHSFVGSLLLR